ncbi:hypothetical protein [Halobacillus salinus]|uniref:Uncharacterized protein n=1 Tax=Halobacillus salinus TaxID=192814 RepID=A0A4Z0H0Q7_9BACI|nr:hypothetical protein [Halobacillus salinus]TGB03444.1 hypothetical protein E4663_00100 [Halobacillus salinus]
MKKNNPLLGIYMLVLSLVPIAMFGSLMFLPGSKQILVIWGVLGLATILTILSFKKHKILASIALILLVATASLITFAAMMAGMSPNS